jgi:ABC-type branched-subunit amino acid transport system ATPase component
VSLLRAENLSKNFGSLIAANNVSNPTSCGRSLVRTAFFNMISGFLTQSEGRVIFDGEDIRCRCQPAASGATSPVPSR